MAKKQAVELHDDSVFIKYIPPLWFNKTKAVTVELKCASTPEIQNQARAEIDLAPESLAKANHEFVQKYVGEIKGLKKGGKHITCLKDVYENGPIELYAWIKTAVMSTRILGECERKN
jgi:hypothetical protein